MTLRRVKNCLQITYLLSPDCNTRHSYSPQIVPYGSLQYISHYTHFLWLVAQCGDSLRDFCLWKYPPRKPHLVFRSFGNHWVSTTMERISRHIFYNFLLPKQLVILCIVVLSLLWANFEVLQDVASLQSVSPKVFQVVSPWFSKQWFIAVTLLWSSVSRSLLHTPSLL